THAYAHLLADPDKSGQAMHLAVFAPAFTFSLCESESSRKWNMPSIGTAVAHSLGRYGPF
ncbi:MAG: hypothetical protein WCS79_06030, partial [Paludibacter sp.]